MFPALNLYNLTTKLQVIFRWYVHWCFGRISATLYLTTWGTLQFSVVEVRVRYLWCNDLIYGVIMFSMVWWCYLRCFDFIYGVMVLSMAWWCYLWYNDVIYGVVQQVRLVVDGCDVANIDETDTTQTSQEDRRACEAVSETPGDGHYLSISTPLQLGGRSNSDILYPQNVIQHGFTGCIKNLVHNGQVFSSLSWVFQRFFSVQIRFPCLCTCRVMYHDESRMKLQEDRKHCSRWAT